MVTHRPCAIVSALVPPVQAPDAGLGLGAGARVNVHTAATAINGITNPEFLRQLSMPAPI